MSEPKRRPPQGTGKTSTVSMEAMRTAKVECDRIREKIQKSVIDNPQVARKAALLITLWIEGKERRRKKAG